MPRLTKTLLVLLGTLCLAGQGLAKDVSNATLQDIQDQIDSLKADVEELTFLSDHIEASGEAQQDILLYRRDVRSFHALKDFDSLVEKIAALPRNAAAREEFETKLTEPGNGVGDAIFNRISEINQRISEAEGRARSLDGGALIATQAHIESLENIRLKYYEALVDHLESRKALGLSLQQLRNRLDPILLLSAETLAGRIEMDSSVLAQLRNRSVSEPDNAEVKAMLMKIQTRQGITLNQLGKVITVLDKLDLESADFKAVALLESGNLSVSMFSSNAFFAVLAEGWAAFKETFVENAPDFFFHLLLFIGVLFVFRILSRITRRAVEAATERSSLNTSALLKRILISTSGGTVMAIGVLVALSQIGITLAPMLAGLGVAGFIVGFALQDSLSNFAAGAMILVYRPFDVGDFIEVTGASGLVKKMNLVSTTITTFDNQTLVVPNSKIWGDVIKNVTAQTERRVDLEFGIGYDDDIEHAERILTEIVTAHDKVLKQPEPMIKLHTLGDSSVNFIVRPWSKTEDYWAVYWDIMREVKLRFDREGISIPFPQRDVHLYSNQGQ